MDKQERSPSSEPRKLQLRARAERQLQTRRRITQAAVELHESVGPLATTISAIADRAGVERLTVYRHFPDEEALFAACTQHYFSAIPPPDTQAWMRIADPKQRLRRALTELYGFYARSEQMTASILRDAEMSPDRIGGGYRQLTERMRDVLASGWGVRGRRKRLLLAALGLASSFQTWRLLVREGSLREIEAVDLMTDLVLATTAARHVDGPTR